MIQECKLLAKCGIFNKYQGSQYGLCNALINQYCQGGKQSQCKRMMYREMHNKPPPDEMVPTGQIFHVTPEEIRQAQHEKTAAGAASQKKTLWGSLKAFFLGD